MVLAVSSLLILLWSFSTLNAQTFPCNSTCDCAAYIEATGDTRNCITCFQGQCQARLNCSLGTFCTSTVPLTCSTSGNLHYCLSDADCVTPNGCQRCLPTNNETSPILNTTISYCRTIEACFISTCSTQGCCQISQPPTLTPLSPLEPPLESPVEAPVEIPLESPVEPPQSLVSCNTSCDCANFSTLDSIPGFQCASCIDGACQKVSNCSLFGVCVSVETLQCVSEGDGYNFTLCSTSADCPQIGQCSECVMTPVNVSFCRHLFDCPGNCNATTCQCEIPLEPLESPIQVPQESPIQVPLEPPIQEPQESPLESPIQEPMEGPLESPAETPLESPSEIPSEAPSVAPSAQPLNCCDRGRRRRVKM